jgi:RNA polymerase sigma-70 factor (ECF subfamily)
MSAVVPRESDVSARAAVFCQCEQRLRRFFSRRVRNGSEVSRDLTQEVCLRFLAKEHIVAGDSYGYLFGIARHVLADFLRQSLSAERLAHDLARVRDSESSLRVANDPADSAETEAELDRALKHLSRPHLAVLLARERDGYSYREIAERLQLSQQTVEKYLFLAKSAVRSHKDPS